MGDINLRDIKKGHFYLNPFIPFMALCAHLQLDFSFVSFHFLDFKVNSDS